MVAQLYRKSFSNIYNIPSPYSDWYLNPDFVGPSHRSWILNSRHDDAWKFSEWNRCSNIWIKFLLLAPGDAQGRQNRLSYLFCFLSQVNFSVSGYKPNKHELSNADYYRRFVHAGTSSSAGKTNQGCPHGTQAFYNWAAGASLLPWSMHQCITSTGVYRSEPRFGETCNICHI